MAHGVYPSVHTMESPAVCALARRVSAHADRSQLGQSNDAVLAFGEPRDDVVERLVTKPDVFS
jgi:hypothetical protein